MPIPLSHRMFSTGSTPWGVTYVAFWDADGTGGTRITPKWDQPSRPTLDGILDVLRRAVEDHIDEHGRFEHAGLTAELEVTEDAVKLRGIEIDYGTALRRNCWPAYFEAWAQLNEREMEQAPA